MDHPQSVLLGRVVQSNISLGDAYVNNSERPKLVPRWTYLQQAVNVLFDSKTATSESLFFFFYVNVLFDSKTATSKSLYFSFSM